MKKPINNDATQFPSGWNENRVQSVFAHCQKEIEDQEAEQKSAAQTTFTTMKIPRDLVPAVRRLVATHSKSSFK